MASIIVFILDSICRNIPDMNLQDEWNRLENEKDSGKRARQFEIFLLHLLERDSFKVTHNPKAARPRQTDLVARRNQTYFLVEVKWTRRKTSISDIAQLRDRLLRVPADLFACIFSVSGFSESAVQEVCRDKNREIYLFNKTEMQAMVESSLSFQELLDEKRKYLKTHGVAFLCETVPTVGEYHLRTEPDLFRIGEQSFAWFRSRTGHNDIIFSNELLDCTGRFSNSVFSLQLHPHLDSLHDLKRLFNRLQNWFGLSAQGSFSIHQGGEGWFGFGFESFFSAVGGQGMRYKELNWNSYHHSEELAYLDRTENGALLCVTSRQSTIESYLHSTHLEIYFPGIPVDLSNVRRLCDFTRNEEAEIELVDRNPVHEVHLNMPLEVKPVAPIVSNWHRDRACSGLVIKNPLLDESISLKGEDDFAKVSHLIRESEFWFCALRNWHNPGILMKRYRLISIQVCSIERFSAFHVLCDWD